MKRPAFIDDQLMQLAFRDFVLFLWEDAEMRAAFEQQTVTKPLPSPRNGLDVLIDQATGAGAAYAEAFMAWAIEQWGVE